MIAQRHVGRGAVLAALLAVIPLAAHEPPRESPAQSLAELLPGGPAELGASAAQLRERFGDALVAGRKSLVAPVSALPEDARWTTCYRLVKGPEAAVAVAEYELFDDTLVRLRWQLVKEFEVPALDALIHTSTHRFGPPTWDQELEGQLGSGRATLRRIGWELTGRNGAAAGSTFELRQLVPLTGGPVYLTWTDQAALEAALAAGSAVPPQPDRVAAWWSGKPKAARVPSDEERRELGWVLGDFLRGLKLTTARFQSDLR